MKKAYWKLARKYHPVSKEKDAEERFKKIKAFREVVQGIIGCNSTLPWISIATIIVAWQVFTPPHS